jgi:predicted Rossmann fold nucleotide-binding protein DprA/Smf involved in DNA uptake
MGRNKLIYAMADYGLVVSAEYKKGGTWAGAIEELNRDNSRPVFVRTGNNAPLGNNKLLDCGAIAWPQNTEKERLQQHLEEISSNLHCQGQINQPSLFDTIENAERTRKSKQNKERSLNLLKIKTYSIKTASLALFMKQLFL